MILTTVWSAICKWSFQQKEKKSKNVPFKEYSFAYCGNGLFLLVFISFNSSYLIAWLHGLEKKLLRSVHSHFLFDVSFDSSLYFFSKKLNYILGRYQILSNYICSSVTNSHLHSVVRDICLVEKCKCEETLALHIEDCFYDHILLLLLIHHLKLIIF